MRPALTRKVTMPKNNRVKPQGPNRARSAGSHERLVRRREEQALEALVALALRHDQDGISDDEITKYMSKPTKLSKADQAALDRARPKLLKALREELRPHTKRYMAAWGQAS